MKVNSETCPCKYCEEWRAVVLGICDRLKLDYKKVRHSDKVDLYGTFISSLLTPAQREHNWQLMKHRYLYATLKEETP